MKGNFWSMAFAGVGALAGIVYLYQAHQPQTAPVTNVFPPLNTDDPSAPSGSTGDPLPTAPPVMTSTATTQTNPVAAIPIYYA